MSELLDQIRATVEAAHKIQADVKDFSERPLPPEAQKVYDRLCELHPDAKITFERRIFVRATDDNDLCVDVRNVPDQ